MRSKLTSLFSVILCVSALLSLSSCEEDDTYYSPLVGAWYANYDNYGPIYNNNIQYYNSYFFYGNGTGFYQYYDVRGQWTGMQFTWNSYNDDYVIITYQTGFTQTFYYQFNRKYLELSGDPNFISYTGYAPGNY